MCRRLVHITYLHTFHKPRTLMSSWNMIIFTYHVMECKTNIWCELPTRKHESLLRCQGYFIVWQTRLSSIWWRMAFPTPHSQTMADFTPKWVKLARNGTNSGLFKIRFQNYFSLRKFDLRKCQICPIWCQSDPLCV